MNGCERKIKHVCKHQENVILIIIANDYYNCNLMNMDSTLNDISLVWKFFRRFRCFNPSQIFILGDINFKGRMVPWRNRYILSAVNIPCDKKVFIYYTGHGYSNGLLDIDPITNSYLLNNRDNIIFYILDACWSHLWMDKYDSYICATNEMMELASTTKYFSTFTLNFFRYLIDNNHKGISIEDLHNWTKNFNYLFKCKDKENIIKFLGFREDINN